MNRLERRKAYKKEKNRQYYHDRRSRNAPRCDECGRYPSWCSFCECYTYNCHVPYGTCMCSWLSLKLWYNINTIWIRTLTLSKLVQLPKSLSLFSDDSCGKTSLVIGLIWRGMNTAALNILKRLPTLFSPKKGWITLEARFVSFFWKDIRILSWNLLWRSWIFHLTT